MIQASILMTHLVLDRRNGRRATRTDLVA